MGGGGVLLSLEVVPQPSCDKRDRQNVFFLWRGDGPLFIQRKDLFSSAYNGGRHHVSGEEVALLCLAREAGHPRYRWENISFSRSEEADPTYGNKRECQPSPCKGGRLILDERKSVFLVYRGGRLPCIYRRE